MIPLNIYCILTILLTSYYFYDLHSKEDTFFVFSMHVLKSKFYFCLALNFFIMCLVILGKFLIFKLKIIINKLILLIIIIIYYKK